MGRFNATSFYIYSSASRQARSKKSVDRLSIRTLNEFKLGKAELLELKEKQKLKFSVILMVTSVEEYRFKNK